ncbi:MAG: hypothetical protein ACYTEQ_31105 [Planctomycetota bacterium]
MRITRYHHSLTGDIVGYTFRVSARDTYNWAHRPGQTWPCSCLSDKHLVVDVDASGLCDLHVNGKDNVDVDGTELEALVSDCLPADCRHLWPTWQA